MESCQSIRKASLASVKQAHSHPSREKQLFFSKSKVNSNTISCLNYKALYPQTPSTNGFMHLAKNEHILNIIRHFSCSLFPTEHGPELSICIHTAQHNRCYKYSRNDWTYLGGWLWVTCKPCAIVWKAFEHPQNCVPIPISGGHHRMTYNVTEPTVFAPLYIGGWSDGKNLIHHFFWKEEQMPWRVIFALSEWFCMDGPLTQKAFLAPLAHDTRSHSQPCSSFYTSPLSCSG